jgi:hypothetical protein
MKAKLCTPSGESAKGGHCERDVADGEITGGVGPPTVAWSAVIIALLPPRSEENACRWDQKASLCGRSEKKASSL